MKGYFFFLALAFLSGSTPTAYWTAKRLKGIDIRRHGSGNAGATNVMRVLGKGPGYFVFAIDFLKGFFPVALYRYYSPVGSELEWLAIGFLAVLGHVFSPWLNFRGGKGVATGAGMLAAAAPVNFLAALMLWLMVYFATHMVSIASLVAALGLVVCGLIAHQPPAVIAVEGSLFLFVVWTHRSNIRRLLKGEENTFR